MDKRYEQYCLASPVFYDAPGRAAVTDFDIAERPLPDRWTRARSGDWLISIPPGAKLPAQGWKIHASACLANSERIITAVWDYCVPRDISFKFVSGRLGVFARNGKYAPRGSSGKIVTIYPRDEADCAAILAELDRRLDNEDGPYILSDLRYGSGPLHVRYGGFTERHCLDEHGDLVPAIENEAGDLVPDVRAPVFSMPAWVKLPAFLEPHLAARNATKVDGLPCRVDEVLHFSNGGGVYLGTDERTGARVVLKEARPHAGLAADGSDAVTRLGREHEMLTRLAGLGIAPEVHGYLTAGGHHFLVEEYLEGTPLNACYSARYPLLTADPDPGEIAAYTEWALRICADIEHAAALMHDRGVIFNDLHMFNIIVRPDGGPAGHGVAFIDFEAASDAAEGRLVTVGNPGFAAPKDRIGTGIDRYSLACIRLAMFLPLTTLLPLDPGKTEELADVIARTFPVPAAFLGEAVREIRGAAGGGRPTGSATSQASGTQTSRRYEELSAALCRGILASATPERTDRLFPGDIEQFAAPGGGLGIAHGAAGVLYALNGAAGLRVPQYESWLLARAADPPRGGRLGLYDGLAGVAWVLARLGHTDAAITTADTCLATRWETLGLDLYGGLAGFALAMIDIGDMTAEPRLVQAGVRAAGLVARHSGAPSRAGLLRGAAGHALLFIRLYERTGDQRYLDLAEAELGTDLARCVTDRRGSLQVDEGWRTLPYLGGGSAGIGMVLDRFLAHRPSEAFERAEAAIKVAARSAFYAQAGLFAGRAGQILYLAQSGDSRLTAQVSRLSWHEMRYADGLAYPGDQLLRLSMDLGTGTAGVLLALTAALTGPRERRAAVLPFLGPALDPPGQDPQGFVSVRASVRR